MVICTKHFNHFRAFIYRVISDHCKVAVLCLIICGFIVLCLAKRFVIVVVIVSSDENHLRTHFRVNHGVDVMDFIVVYPSIYLQRYKLVRSIPAKELFYIVNAGIE